MNILKISRWHFFAPCRQTIRRVKVSLVYLTRYNQIYIYVCVCINMYICIYIYIYIYIYIRKRRVKMNVLKFCCRRFIAPCTGKGWGYGQPDMNMNIYVYVYVYCVYIYVYMCISLYPEAERPDERLVD